MNKTCKRCGEAKPVSYFSRRGQEHQPWCKECNKAVKREWIKANRDKVRWNTVWTKYRLRQADYESLMASQNFSCGICCEPFGESTPCIDHDHKCCPGKTSCGKCVRGLLCGDCNKRLGGYEYMLSQPALVTYLTRE